MVHQAKGKLRRFIISARPLAEDARLHIALTFPRSQEDVPASSFADHLLCDLMVLVLIAVRRQLRPVLVPFKMGADLIAAVFQISIVAEIISSRILDRADSLCLHLDRMHHAHGIDDPDDRRLPIDRLQDALERLIGRHLIAALFSADTQDGVREQGIVPRYLKLHDVVVPCVFQAAYTSINPCFFWLRMSPTVSS